MIRACRTAAMAQDDAAMITGWNISPNVAYIVTIFPGVVSCGVLLQTADGTLVASGAALTGTNSPCVLVPNTAQLGMNDAALGWHMLLTTDGTESQRAIHIGPAVDIPDEIHPVYGDNAIAFARATATIDEAAHYLDDITMTCPLGLGAGVGTVVSVPVDGAGVVGYVESITWTGTPDGTDEQAVIRRHIAIAPGAFVEPAAPSVADDAATTDADTVVSGNVLANDATSLAVVAVNGLSANVGVVVDGSNGGTFMITPDGSWTFDPSDDFGTLGVMDTVTTSVTYHASDGQSEAEATLAVLVLRVNTAPVVANDTASTDAMTQINGNVLINDVDAESDVMTVVRVNGDVGNVGMAVPGSFGGLFTVNADGSWVFSPNDDFWDLTGEQTTTTSVTYHAGDGRAESEGTLSVIVGVVPVVVGVSLFASVDYVSAAFASTVTRDLPAGVQPGDLVLVCIGNNADNNRDFVVTGYTEIADLFASDTRSVNLGVFFKVMTDPVDTTVTMSGPNNPYHSMIYWIAVFRGVDNTTPLDVAPTTATGTNSHVPNPPAITPTTDGAMLLSIISSAIDTPTGGTLPAQSVSAPTGFDLEYWISANNISRYVASLGVASREWGAADGAVDPAVWSTIFSNNTTYCSWAAATVALRPAS